MKFSPNGLEVLTVTDRHTAKLWNAQTGFLIHTFNVQGLTSAAFSPNGLQLVTGSLGKTIKFWNVQTGTLLRTHTFNADVTGVV